MDYEEYLEKRKELAAENESLLGVVLSPIEKRAEEKLDGLKKEAAAVLPGDKIYKMPILRYGEIANTALYRAVQKMPKGSDLHVHATALVPAESLIDFVLQEPELLVDTVSGKISHKNENIDLSNSLPLKEIFGKGILNKEAIIDLWTMRGIKHGENVWDYFEKLLCIFESIEVNPEILYRYYLFAFNHYLTNGIFHVEIHALFSEDYEATKKLCNIIKRAYFDFKKEHSEFVVSIICAGLKYDGIDLKVPEKYLENALKLRAEVLDDFNKDAPVPFIIGFDLINEEDRSVSLKNLAPILLDCKKNYPDFNLYIHCGESLVAESDNLIDGFLLGATRVGHGMNLYRFPKLLENYRKSEICLETCLVSNQSLGYVKDLRLHPAFSYLKRGLTVALCSDDPVCQEKNVLTDDFFIAILAWDLNLAEIKQLCINSILYSGLEANVKSALIANWKTAWQEFLENI